LGHRPRGGGAGRRGGLWLSGAFTPSSFTESVTVEPQGYFFRMQASYTHGDEKIDFDYVAVCGYRTTIYKDNSRSNDGTYAPKVMIKATGDGGALMMRTPRACKGQTTTNGKAPSDLLPFVVWFDDVADLTFGFGYASPDAYDSPHAQVQFHGATIEKASAADWKAWRAKAEAEYEPKGMLPGPWGYSYPAGHGRTTNVPYDPARRILVRNCKGYFRLKLPEEVRPQIRELWPEDRPKFWVQPPKVRLHDRYRLADGTERNARYEGGREYFNFPAFNGGNGVPTRIGSGVLPEGAFIKYPADTFPLLPRSRVMDPVPTAPADSYPRRLLIHEDMKGFVACGGDAPVDYVELFDPKFRAKAHPIYANDELIAKDYNPQVEPTILYQRDEYIFDRRAWPGLM
jgi:hypothetical protein